MKNKLLTTSFLLLLTSSLFSQTTDNKDLALWSSVGVNYSPVKNLKLELEQQIRLKENASVTDEYFTQINIEYEFIKNLVISGGVRFINENDNVGKIQGYEKHFRFNFDFGYSHDINRFEVGYRIRYQNKRELNLPVNSNDLVKENIRFKLGVKYKIKKWPLDPKISAEIFSRRREKTLLVSEAKLSRYRITLGTDYSLKKFGKIGAYYRFQENINSNTVNFITTIVGLKYTYSIN